MSNVYGKIVQKANGNICTKKWTFLVESSSAKPAFTKTTRSEPTIDSKLVRNLEMERVPSQQFKNDRPKTNPIQRKKFHKV
jgi:hypothetical protein